jgi:NAD(P)-dependent dehydrogenase (short-subunit alcohol dehydrogenase family)
MLRQGSGSIINIASVVRDRGCARSGTVCVGSEAGVVELTKVAAVEWAAGGAGQRGRPGNIDTPMLPGAYERGAIAEDDVVARIPAGRVATVEEIARVVAFQASDTASYVTGQPIAVDGGSLPTTESG